MKGKSTDELEKTLGSTHPKDAAEYLKKNEESLLPEDHAFAEYMREILKEKQLLQQEVFLRADIPERYGYKLISQEKHTKQRDIILRICYASEMTLEETQKALRIYRMPELYAKVSRDALIMIAFNERPGDVIELNQFLKQNGMEPLRSSGTVE